jgi:hypothetical protein
LFWSVLVKGVKNENNLERRPEGFFVYAHSLGVFIGFSFLGGLQMMTPTTEEKLAVAISVLKEIAKKHTFWYDEYANYIHDSECSGCKASSTLYKMNEKEK